MKNITAILNAITAIINASETTATTTTTTKTTVMLDGKPTTTTSTSTTTATTRTRITKPEAPKQPTLITKLIPAVGWENPFAEPLKLRDEPFRLITSDFKKEVSQGTTYYMMTVIREYPDGRQEKPQREGNTLRDFKKNLEGWISSLKEDIALRSWDHALFVDNSARRWWYYLTTESINDPEVQALMRWFNRQIKNVNAFTAAVKARLEAITRKGEADENALLDTINNLTDSSDELCEAIGDLREQNKRLSEENASLDANLTEAERDLETTQIDLVQAEETIDDLNKRIAEIRYEVSCSHAREIKNSERINSIETELFRLAEDLGYAEECKHTNAEPIIEVLRKHLVK